MCLVGFLASCSICLVEGKQIWDVSCCFSCLFRFRMCLVAFLGSCRLLLGGNTDYGCVLLHFLLLVLVFVWG